MMSEVLHYVSSKEEMLSVLFINFLYKVLSTLISVLYCFVVYSAHIT